MASLKSLAKDTAIYGMSSIIGRFLNYLLVPLYTAKISAASGGYGVITNMYAYTALILVILTYGMETTFFRFVNKEGENSEKVYHTVLSMVGFTSLLFIAVHRFGVPLYFSFKQYDGLCRSSCLCMDNVCHRGDRCVPMYTVCIP